MRRLLWRRLQADANVFFMYDAEEKNKGQCPEDSTDGESERFKQGYMIFKPRADVKGPEDNQCMYGNKKVNLGRHACLNVVKGEANNERLHACGAGFVKLVLAELAAKEGARSLMLSNFHNIEECRSSDEKLHPKAATDPWALVPAIAAEAGKFAAKELGGEGAEYIALHLKRDDQYREDHADAYFSEDALVERMAALAREHGILRFFLATTEKNEVMYLRKKLERELKDEDGNCVEGVPDCADFKLAAYKRRPSTGFKGLQVGFVEQTIATKAKVFVGAQHSQFTRRIHEQREARANAEHDSVLKEGAELLPWSKY